MSDIPDIKIRALPRSSPKPAKGQEKDTGKKNPRWIIYVGSTSCLVAAAFLWFAQKPHNTVVAKTIPKNAKKSGQSDLASSNARVNDSITRHLQETEVQREMMVRKQEIDNLPFKNAKRESRLGSLTGLPEETRNLGVQVDTDGAAERVYEDLQTNNGIVGELLPADKINARLANRKWMNEMERAERIQYISDFIRTAYDKGYEVEIDQNLVVVGVKKINRTQTLNINQVIDRLAKQGQ